MSNDALTQQELDKITIRFLENEIKVRDELLTKIQEAITLYTQNGILPEVK